VPFSVIRLFFCGIAYLLSTELLWARVEETKVLAPLSIYPFLHGFLMLGYIYVLLFYFLTKKWSWLYSAIGVLSITFILRYYTNTTFLASITHTLFFGAVTGFTHWLSLMIRPLEAMKLRNQVLENQIAQQLEDIEHEHANLEAVLESTTDLIYSLDTEYRFVTLNTATRKVYHTFYKHEIELGQRYTDVTAENVQNVMLLLFRKGLAGEFVKEKVTYTALGQTFHREVAVNPIREKDGHIVGISVFSKDINEAELVAQNLRYTESLLESTFDQSPDALFLLNINTFTIMRCNRRALELFEVENELALVGKTGLEFHKTPLPASATKTIIKQIREKGVWSNEYEYVSLQGSIFWGILKISSLLLGDNKALLARVSDITERKLNEEKIIAKEANLRAILESNDQSIWLTDTNNMLLVHNQVFVQMLEQTFGLELKPNMDLVKSLPYIYQTMWKLRYKRVFQGERQDFIDAYEYKGNEYIYQITGFPVYEQSEGKPSSASFFARDITKQVLAERKLSANQKLLDSINQHLKDALFRITANGALVYANLGFFKMFGYEEDEMQRIDVNELYVDVPVRSKLQKMLLKNHIIENQECRFRKKDGFIFWASISATQNYDEFGEIYYDGIVRDITEARKAKNELKKQNKKLKKVNGELDKFVYSASHDLRAPLSSLLGLLDLVRLVQDEEEKQQLYAMMTKSVKKLDEFINQIIQYSRNSRIEVKPEKIDFQELMGSVFDNLKYMPNSEQVQQILDMDLQTPFYSDYFRLSVILNNLVSNAIRYANLQASKPFVKVLIVVNEEKAHIEVSDNGQGIEEKFVPHIFKMFYRATEHNTGSGIGLYILKETLEVLKGKIYVQSTLGEGTIFTLDIPNLPAPNSQN
jgi:PAS domain S-box-containing protein